MHGSPSYQLRVSTEVPDSEWDTFVQTTPGGTYHQSTCWAQVKAAMGWKSVRLLMYRGRELLGGCQLFLKPVPLAGAIAYAPRGPLIADRDGGTLNGLLNALAALVRQERIIYFKLQPPPDNEDITHALQTRGFVQSSLEAAPTATIRIDLRPAPQSLHGAMHRNAQRNLRKARQAGVVIREGTETDLPTLSALLEATGRRQGFSPYPVGYYEEMWRAFALDERAALFVAEHEGSVLAFTLVIGFADTATYKMGAWSGTKRDVPPNELLHWTGMQWGKERGYRYYDFDDIDVSVARAMAAGDPLPAKASEGLTRFKLGFGGEASVLPGAHDYVSRPVLSYALRQLAPRLDRLRPLAKRALGRSNIGVSL